MVISWLLLAVTSHIVVAFNPLPSASFSSMSGSFETYSPIIAVLTLERHLNGVWISKLMEALVRLCKQESMNARPTLYTLESFQMSDFAKGNVSTDWLCFVNRVSDAASPTEVKVRQCLMELRIMQLWNFILLAYIYEFFAFKKGMSSCSLSRRHLEYTNLQRCKMLYYRCK